MTHSPRIVVVHGYNAHPGRHWFEWLAGQYNPGVVMVPALPNPQHPSPDAWIRTLGDAVGDVDEHTFFVCHSLGCIATIRMLEQFPRPWRVGGLVLVAGFGEPLATLPQLDAFTHEPIEASVIVDNALQRHVFGSDDDPTVAPELTARFAEQLAAPLTIVPGAQHFTDDAGAREVPGIVPVLDRMLGADLAESASERSV
ncbi:alpha/beta hydrolase [Okibacterium endophyticum]